MTNKTIEQQLIDNISQLLKRALSADDILEQLRKDHQASFNSIFKKDSPFQCDANTFSPYIGEISDQLRLWQQSQDKSLLVELVKKIELLFKVLAQFEQSVHSASQTLTQNSTARH
jgi:hypothetical protein